MEEHTKLLQITGLLLLATSDSTAALAIAKAFYCSDDSTNGVAVFLLLTAMNRAWLRECAYSNQRQIKLGTD